MRLAGLLSVTPVVRTSPPPCLGEDAKLWAMSEKIRGRKGPIYRYRTQHAGHSRLPGGGRPAVAGCTGAGRTATWMGGWVGSCRPAKPGLGSPGTGANDASTRRREACKLCHGRIPPALALACWSSRPGAAKKSLHSQTRKTAASCTRAVGNSYIIKNQQPHTS